MYKYFLACITTAFSKTIKSITFKHNTVKNIYINVIRTFIYYVVDMAPITFHVNL